MKMDSMVDVRVRYFPECLQEQYNRDFARVPLQICSAEYELGATRSQLCFRAHNVSADRRSRSCGTRGHCYVSQWQPQHGGIVFPVQASDAECKVSQSSVGHRSQTAWPVNEVPINISIRCAKLLCGSKRSTSAI